MSVGAAPTPSSWTVRMTSWFDDLERDVDVARLGVLRHVGESFLDDPKQRDRARPVQPRLLVWISFGAAEVRTLAGFLALPAQCGQQAHGIEQGRSQLLDDPPLELDALVEHVPQAHETLLYARVFTRPVPLHPGHVHSRSQQDAAELVVQAPRQSCTLLLLDVLQVPGEVGQLPRLRVELRLEFLVLPFQFGRGFRTLAHVANQRNGRERGEQQPDQQRREIQSTGDRQLPFQLRPGSDPSTPARSPA